MTAPTTTTPTVVQLIDFAAAHPGRFNGTVEEAIRAELRITPARYFQLLSRAIRTREALERDPQTTNRLLRQATDQARTRAARITL